MTQILQPLIGFSLDQLKRWCALKDVPAFRASQIYNWVYAHGVSSFDAMRTLPAPIKKLLAQDFFLKRLSIKTFQSSKDGTQKWLLSLDDGNEVEVVHIPEKTRGTLCISSQVGCTLTCKFCHTGTQTWVRNLTAYEILAQVYAARDLFNEWPPPQENRHVSHIVFMGMGEPLYNFEEVKKAIQLLTDPKGINMPKRSITLSTSGVVPFIQTCGEELGVNLAVSLHAPRNDLRDQIVPLNKKYPLEELLAACRTYPGATKSNRITFEYVMLDAINDTPKDAHDLAKILTGIPCKINLIPFNPWPKSPYTCSAPKTIQTFGKILENSGYPVTIRKTRGQDILAACGQLKSESQRQRKSKA